MTDWISMTDKTPGDAGVDCEEVWTWDGKQVHAWTWEGGWSHGVMFWNDPVLHDLHITHWMPRQLQRTWDYDAADVLAINEVPPDPPKSTNV